MVFFSMVQEVEPPTESSPLLVTQELRSLGDRVLLRSAELLVNTVITARTLVVNCGAEPRELRLLLQCPEGSIPVGKGSFYTRSVDVAVPAFGSERVDNYFYFPIPGSFRWFPAHALADEKLVAYEVAGPPLRVVAERGAVDAASWRDVATRGSLDDVLAFLRRPPAPADAGPPEERDLVAIAWRMRDAGAFNAVVNELRSQLRFSRYIWGYGFFHQDTDVIREFLVMNKKFQRLAGPRVESGLLTTEAYDGSIYEHVDFADLVLSRAHTVGAARQNIEDADLRKAYAQFLAELSYAAALSLEDRVVLTNFMLMQDRVDEARVAFEPVKEVLVPRLTGAAPPLPGPLHLQAAYQMAYLDLIACGDLAGAKLALAAFAGAAWLTKPWRARYATLKNAVQEMCPTWQSGDEAAARRQGGGAAGAARTPSSTPHDDGVQDASALGAASDGADLNIEEVDAKGHRVRLSRKGLRPASCSIACYVVDVELTFSASPFAGSEDADAKHDSASPVNSIAPTLRVSVEDGKGCSSEVAPSDWVALPPAMLRRQMVLEVVATSGAQSGPARGRRLAACRPCYFCDAVVAFEEAAGILKVTENGKPTGGAYVKVFARGGSDAAKFYKDGYTDCLGTFDYVSLNAKRFPLSSGKGKSLAVLVVTKDSGAMVREVSAPKAIRPTTAHLTPPLSAAETFGEMLAPPTTRRRDSSASERSMSDSYDDDEEE